jgi:ankyrin repeat protein
LRAVRKGNKAIIRLLLEKGARPDFADSIGRTPLSVAKGIRDKTIIKLLESYVIMI